MRLHPAPTRPRFSISFARTGRRSSRSLSKAPLYCARKSKTALQSLSPWAWCDPMGLPACAPCFRRAMAADRRMPRGGAKPVWRAREDGPWPVRKLANGSAATEADRVEQIARTLLRRYGVVFLRMLEREAGSLPKWRDLLRVYRQLEARGEIRGGRFVAGFSGEQFALPEAVAKLRSTRRQDDDGALVSLSGADPLNLAGILMPGPKLPAVAGNRVLFRDGIPIAFLEAGEVRFLDQLDASGRSPSAHGVVGSSSARPALAKSRTTSKPGEETQIARSVLASCREMTWSREAVCREKVSKASSLSLSRSPSYKPCAITCRGAFFGQFVAPPIGSTGRFPLAATRSLS